MHVAVAREAHAGQHRAAGRDLLPIEADALGESQPQLQSTLAGRVAVVIANPTDPHAPEGGILRLRQDQGVLDRHPRLVVVAVEHPLLQLQTRQLAVVHQVVIADRKSTRLNSSHLVISYAVFCLKKKKKYYSQTETGSNCHTTA